MLVEIMDVDLIIGALVVMMDEEDDLELRASDLDEVLAARCASL